MIAEILSASTIHPVRRKVVSTDNKYSRGIVGVVAGSERYPGAAVLTVGGARRGNAGYVKFISSSERLHDLILTRFPDVVPIREIEETKMDALVVGPGLGDLKALPEGIPLVLDGASIEFITESGFSGRHPITVITPHEGEVRYCGLEVTTPLDQDQRKNIAAQIAREHGVITVLKGHRTLVAEPDGEHFIDELGGPELATAGSGDLLAGLIGAFLVTARDMSSAMDLVCRAVSLHSKAGRYAAEHYTSVTAVEIMEALAQV